MTNILKDSRNDRRNSIREMLRKKHTQTQISLALNLSQSTISNEINSMLRESNVWFGDLVSKTFIHEYHETIKGLDQSINDSFLQIDKLEKRTQELRTLNEEHLKEGGDVKTVGTSSQLLSNLITIESNYHTARQNYEKMIDDARKKRGELLHKGPMMYSIEAALKKGGNEKMSTPVIKVLDNSTDELNTGE